MFSPAFLCTALLLCLLFSAGCDSPLIQGGPNDRLPPAQPELNLRNQLLEKLQGKSRDQKLQTLLEIVTQDSSDVIRRDALVFLCGLGKDASPIEKQLAQQLLDEGNTAMVPHLQQALIEIQTDIETYLLNATATTNQIRLLRIIEVLGKLPASKSETVTFLSAQLDSSQHAVKLSACNALCKIGPTARAALPQLIELAAKPRVPLAGSTDRGQAFRDSRDLQVVVVRAIASLGADESAIDVLTAALEQEPQIAEHAAKALAGLGPAAASALPALEKLEARNDHGGKDVKTRLAREAASDAIKAIKSDRL